MWQPLSKTFIKRNNTFFVSVFVLILLNLFKMLPNNPTKGVLIPIFQFLASMSPIPESIIKHHQEASGTLLCVCKALNHNSRSHLCHRNYCSLYWFIFVPVLLLINHGLRENLPSLFHLFGCSAARYIHVNDC